MTRDRKTTNAMAIADADRESPDGFQHRHYQRIEKAIAYINAHFKEQPSLDDIAAAVHTSPFHFQRMFTEWAGVSPKKFLQYTSVEHAKQILGNGCPTLQDAAHLTGLSGTGRLHDLFVTIEGMTPGEYKSGGKGLSINYSFANTPFGQLIIASTEQGVCHMFFDEDKEQAIADLKSRFPQAAFQPDSDRFQHDALVIFNRDWNQPEQIKLHLAATPFQLKVWQSLLKIPSGQLSCYGDIANSIQQPKAARAVGTAIGANPIAFLIPCHRVIQQSGQFGGYRWGPARKSALIAWEAARQNSPGE